MAITEKELRQDIKDGLRPLYVLYGEEAYLTAYYADAIAKAAVPEDMGGFNMVKFDADTATLDQIEQAIDALPLMVDRKCVMVRDLDFTAGDTAERLMPLLESPSEFTVVVLTYIQLQPQPSKNAKWKALLETAERNGGVVQFKKKTAAELTDALCRRAARADCILSAANAALLVEQVGDDMLLLGNELDKLIALANGGEVTAALIRTAATKNLEAKVFDLSKAILRRRSDEAYGILNTLLQQREEPVAILAVLGNTYVDMYRMKVATEAGVSTQQVASTFAASYNRKEFRLRYAAQDAARLTVAQLREKLEVLATADTLLKSSRAVPRFVLEETIAKLL